MIIASADQYFNEIVQEAIKSRNVVTSPLVHTYLVELLQHYIKSDNFEIDTVTGESEEKSKTFAEAILKASSLDQAKKRRLLKNIGDLSLYISGFFGDSLQRKIVDLDYYADIGGIAYSTLAAERSHSGEVYEEFSKKFTTFVDVLTYISHKANIQTNGDLLRLYDRYISTGSGFAKEQLLEKGILSTEIKKKLAQ